MARKGKSRPRSFSPAFDTWLRWCEQYEDFSAGRRKKLPADMIYHEDLFVVRDDELGPALPQLIDNWASTAKAMRSAMKFRYVHPTANIISKGRQNPNEGIRMPVWMDTPVALPFPLTYVEVDIGGTERSPDNKAMMMLEERYATDVPDRWTDRYTQMGIAPGEKFICCIPAIYNSTGIIKDGVKDPSSKLSVMPVEMHIPIGPLVKDNKADIRSVAAFPVGVDGSGFMETYNNTVLNHLMLFLILCHSRNPAIRRTVPGLPREARKIIKKHRRKPMESTFYEHHVLEIPAEGNIPLHFGEGTPGTRKRLHAVRSHMRHYSKPLKSGPNKGKMSTLIPPQWRGDEKLGVVTKDYDFMPPKRDDEGDQ
jgi:hypothetical protein